MSPIRFTIGLVAAWFAAQCWAQSSHAQASGVLLVKAIENNRDLLAVRQRIEEARGMLRQAGVRPAPTLDAGGATGRPLGSVGEEQFGAGIAQTFETGGKRSKRIQVAEKQLALAEAEYDERVRQLRYEVRRRYAEYAAEAERLRILERLRETYVRSLELMTARVQQGDAAALERDMLLVESARADAQRAALLGAMQSAKADLARITGAMDPAEIGEPPTTPPAAPALDLDRIKRQSLAQRPDLRAAEIVHQQGEAESDLAQAQGKADLTLSAGYNRIYSRFDDQYGLTPAGTPTALRDRDDILSVGISIPLFGRNRNRGEIEAAVARTRGARYRKEYLEASIPLEIESAWSRYTSALRTHDTLEQTVLRQSERNLEVMQKAYRLGQYRLLDVLNEQRRFLDSQLAAVGARLDVMLGLAELERASGGELQ